MRGQAFKSLIFICFSFLFAQLNSQWADNFLRNSSASICPHELMAEMMTETFLNTKAVTIVAKKNNKQFAEVHSSYFKPTEEYILTTEKAKKQVFSTTFLCAVKSYLHLLNLF